MSFESWDKCVGPKHAVQSPVFDADALLAAVEAVTS